MFRNRRRRLSRSQRDDSHRLIAKVDASIFNKNSFVGQFYLVPVIAKVDSLGDDDEI